jgi:hypothetical protein
MVYGEQWRAAMKDLPSKGTLSPATDGEKQHLFGFREHSNTRLANFDELFAESLISVFVYLFGTSLSSKVTPGEKRYRM